MKNMVILIVLFFMGAPVVAQVVGKPFPAISAENIHEKIISIPAQTKGKFTLIGMAYSKKAGD